MTVITNNSTELIDFIQSQGYTRLNTKTKKLLEKSFEKFLENFAPDFGNDFKKILRQKNPKEIMLFGDYAYLIESVEIACGQSFKEVFQEKFDSIIRSLSNPKYHNKIGRAHV